MDSRRYLSTFAVFALVLLRLVIGWHFFREGGEKLKYNRHDDEWRMVFSADGFLSQAQGPLAKYFRSQAPDDHGYRELLAVPRENVPPSPEQVVEASQWQADYKRRRDEAQKAGGEVPVEFPPSAPYHDWAERIASDWRTIRDDVKTVPGLTNEQKHRPMKRLPRGCSKWPTIWRAKSEPSPNTNTSCGGWRIGDPRPRRATCLSTTNGSPPRPAKPKASRWRG